jgi:hypothetical protein
MLDETCSVEGDIVSNSPILQHNNNQDKWICDINVAHLSTSTAETVGFRIYTSRQKFHTDMQLHRYGGIIHESRTEKR